MTTLQAFASPMLPLRRAKAIAALETQVRVNGGEFMLRHQLIEQRVADGARVVGHKTFGRVLMRPDGAFLDTRNITATGLDYAEFLLSNTAL